VIDLDLNEISSLTMYAKHALINFRKAPSPLLIHLQNCKILELFPYQTSFSCLSPDETVVLIHSNADLHYHTNTALGLDRKLVMPCPEIPHSAVFTRQNTSVFLLLRDTRQLVLYTVDLAKSAWKSQYVLQDRDIQEVQSSPDESWLLVRALTAIYVVDTQSLSVRFKLRAADLPAEFMPRNETG
jgi:hypothetical protein